MSIPVLQNIRHKIAACPRWLRTLVCALVVFSPAMVLAYHVSQNAVNTPVWDDWERGPLIQKFMNGTLTFRELYAPHIDHRIFFPRLIILGLNAVTEGDLRWEVAVSFLCGLAAALGVASLARMTVLKNGNIWGVILAANIIIFSPIQWDNWLWGIQLAFMTPMACLIWTLVVTLKPWRWWVRLAVCGVLAIIGTHSFGHGFIIWPTVLGMALLAPNFTPRLRERILFVTLWVALTAVVLGFYTLSDFNNISHSTHSYGQEAGTPPPSVVHHGGVLAQPARALNFVATLAGNPFARMHLVDPMTTAPVIGMILIGIFILFCLQRLWAFWKRPEVFSQALPWMALGGAALVAMSAVAAGRLHTSLTRAASIRYVSISEYLAVAVLMLGVLWWRRRATSDSAAAPRYPWGVLALGLFIGFMVPAWTFGIQMMSLIKEARMQGHASLMFINFFAPEAYHRIDASVEFPRKYANFLDSHGLIDPPLVKTLDLHQFAPNHRDRPVKEAAVESFTSAGADKITIAGYARLEGRTAEAVLLTRETETEAPIIFGLAEPTTEMVPHPYPNDLELAGRMKAHPRAYCQWAKTFTLRSLFLRASPETQEVVVRTWVFDMTNEKARRIQGAWKVTREGKVTMITPTGLEEKSEANAIADDVQ